MKAAQDIACDPHADYEEVNLPRKLGQIRKARVDVIKRTTQFRRKPATHIFVVMISSELRDQKPYAIPVQCIPYAGLKEQDIRRIVNCLINEMMKLGMKVAGKQKA